jgi:glyoxylase-like metal-dependent hydrolase (beta-lactamase superfamily II)
MPHYISSFLILLSVKSPDVNNSMSDMIYIETLTVGTFAMNSYVLTDTTTNECILIDPGAESQRIIQHIESRGINLNSIINTHCHIDHVAELAVVQNHFKVPFYIHEEEKPLLDGLSEQGAFFAIETKGIPDIAGYLNEGDQIEVGKLHGNVFHTPGHSPGSLSFCFDKHMFVGDCIFMDSIGRTDLYKGDYDLLIDSIQTKILNLPTETVLYPGHGPVTTVGRERDHNPFLK